MVRVYPKYDKSCMEHWNGNATNIHNFCKAAQLGKLDKVKEYIDTFKGKKVCHSTLTMVDNELDNGVTPLHCAAQSGNVEVVQLLIENGYDINMGTVQGHTPLYFAAQKRDVDMVKFLIKHGASVNYKDNAGHTLLHLATTQRDPEMAELLMKHGIDINEPDNMSCTPLYWAVRQGYQEIVGLLIKYGIDVNAKDGYSDSTLLHWATKQGYQEIVELLIKHGAEINAKDDRGNTPLHWAAKQGYQEIAELLIKHDVDIVKNNNGKKPSELAIDELLRLKIENYEQVKEIERIEKQTDAEKAEEAAKVAEAEAKAKEREEKIKKEMEEKEKALKEAKAALEKELKETEGKLKEVTDEKTNALEKLLKLQKDMRELEEEQPVIEKVLLDVKKEFDNCGLLQKLGSITNKLEEIQKGMPKIAAYYSTDQSRFENVINNILSNAELLNDNKMKSSIVTTVSEMLNMLKKCGSQSEEKLYLITDKIDEIGKNIPILGSPPVCTDCQSDHFGTYNGEITTI